MRLRVGGLRGFRGLQVDCLEGLGFRLLDLQPRNAVSGLLVWNMGLNFDGFANQGLGFDGFAKGL